MQDRLRLKVNPPNVAVPSNYRDFYVNSDGDFVKRSPDGTIEVAGASTLTFAGSDPNVPASLTVPKADGNATVARIADENGYPKWQTSGQGTMSWSTGSWRFAGVGNPGTVSVESVAATPVGLDFGYGLATGDTPSPAYVGQLCRTPAAWWIWNGTTWDQLTIS